MVENLKAKTVFEMPPGTTRCRQVLLMHIYIYIYIYISSSEGQRCIRRSLAAEDVVAQAPVNHCGWMHRILSYTVAEQLRQAENVQRDDAVSWQRKA